MSNEQESFRTSLFPERTPSGLFVGHPDAEVVLGAGYQITDFGALFGAGRGELLYTVGRTCQWTRSGAITVSRLGRLECPSGRLVTFDPRDSSNLDRTVLALTADVPRGTHTAWLARSSYGEAIAALVVFEGAGPGPIAGWVPALLGAPGLPVPVPPRLSMPPVRYSVGLADEATMKGVLDTLMVAETWERTRLLRRTFGVDAPDEAPPDFEPSRTPSGKHPAIEEIRKAFDEGEIGANAGGIIAVKEPNHQPSTWWGLDAEKRIRALGLDFASMRLWREDDAISQPAVSLDVESLIARFDGPTARAHAEALRKRIDALDDDLWRLEVEPHESFLRK